LSTSVVLPWSTCAMIAILRSFIFYPGFKEPDNEPALHDLRGAIQEKRRMGKGSAGVTALRRI
jgi:hypothetical protein